MAKNTVYELINRGELSGYRVGNQVGVDKADWGLGNEKAAPQVSGVQFLALRSEEYGLERLGEIVDETK